MGRDLIEVEKDVPERAVAMVRTEESRAVAEVKAAIAAAKADPRDTISAQRRILQECKRKSLAEKAAYAYKRGSTLVTGPTIRLAEVIARNWGNLDTGIIELETTPEASVVMAFCRDLESNYTKRIVFNVANERHTKQGVQKLTDARDKYENMANMGARRLRACILACVPGDVVESAEEECDKTLAGNQEEPLIDRLKKMVEAFEKIGVSKELMEKRLGHKLDATIMVELIQMQKIYNSIRDGMATKEEWFEMNSPTTGGKAAELAEKLKEKPKTETLPESEKLPFEKERK